jgi:probable HAF family extracellular repeat protein
MTLNIVFTTRDSVHVGADFRGTIGNAVQSERIPKVLVASGRDWEAVVTFCGVATWGGKDTANWIKTWLEHDADTIRSFEETVAVLERKGRIWLANISRQHDLIPHSFIVAGLEREASKIALISNFERLHGRSIPIQRTLSTEYASRCERVFAFGVPSAVPRSDKRLLITSHKKGDSVTIIQKRIGNIIAAASRRPNGNTIGVSSFSYSILPGGRGQGSLHGRVRGGLEIISIHQGLDPLSEIRRRLGRNAQIFPTGRVHIRSDQSAAVEECKPQLSEQTGQDPSAPSFRIIELPSLGGGNADAKAINSSGIVVGQSVYVPHGALRACLWQNDSVHELIRDARTGWAVDINDKGQIAGTLHMRNGGSRAFRLTGTECVISSTLGGFHSNAHAINNLGEVVGGSWSIPGNTPGDKRERAFKWEPDGRFEDLGALADDYCSRAIAINDNGIVTGQSFPRGFLPGARRAFIWHPSTGIADLEIPGGSSAAIDLNNRDEIVGLFTQSGHSASFIWRGARGTHLLPLPENSSVRAIGDQGEIVYTRDTPLGVRACVMLGEHHVTLPCYLGHESEASSINSTGEIVGKIWMGNHAHAVKWVQRG